MDVKEAVLVKTYESGSSIKLNVTVFKLEDGEIDVRYAFEFFDHGKELKRFGPSQIADKIGGDILTIVNGCGARSEEADGPLVYYTCDDIDRKTIIPFGSPELETGIFNGKKIYTSCLGSKTTTELNSEATIEKNLDEVISRLQQNGFVISKVNQLEQRICLQEAELKDALRHALVPYAFDSSGESTLEEAMEDIIEFINTGNKANERSLSWLKQYIDDDDTADRAIQEVVAAINCLGHER